MNVCNQLLSLSQSPWYNFQVYWLMLKNKNASHNVFSVFIHSLSREKLFLVQDNIIVKYFRVLRKSSFISYFSMDQILPSPKAMLLCNFYRIFRKFSSCINYLIYFPTGDNRDNEKKMSSF